MLAHGRVIDEAGEPVLRASVAVQVLRAVDGKRDTAWVDERLVVTAAGADGRFELSGQPERGRMRLRASGEGYLPAYSREIAHGAAVEIVLVRR